MAKEKLAVSSDRIYTIPLSKRRSKTPLNARAKRTVNDIKRLLEKRAKTDQVKVSPGLNALVWKRGISKPPAKVKVKVSVKDGVATARLPEEIVLEKKAGKKVPKSKIEELKEKADGMKSGKEAAKKDIREDAAKQEEKKSDKPSVQKDGSKKQDSAVTTSAEKPNKDESNSKA